MLSIAAEHRSWLVQGVAAALPLSGDQIWQPPRKTTKKLGEMHLTLNFYNDVQDWLHKCMNVLSLQCNMSENASILSL